MDETNAFLARDGLYYATYQEMRNANVRDNEKRLKALGLDKKLVPVQKRKQVSSYGSNSNKRNKAGDSNTRTTTVRRSNRVRRVTPEQPLGLEEDPFESSRATKKSKVRRTSSTSNAGSGGGTTTTVAAATSSSSRSLSEDDRNKLKNLPDWVNDMEVYLRDEENLSRQNVSSVMRQVAKMATGVGISYSRWNDNVVFAQDRPIDLSDDLDLLYVEAIDFEDEHGKDLGNGWLLRHPIKKMNNFQMYCLEKLG